MPDELRHSEANLRALLEHLPDAVVVSRDQRIVYVNPEALRVLGCASLDDLRGRSVLELIAPEERAEASANLRAGIQSGQFATLERACLRLDGTRFIADLCVLPVELEGQPSILAVARDVTERARMVAALRQSEANFRALIEHAPDGVAVERDGRVLYANGVLARLFGVQPEALVGRAALELVHAEDRAAFAAAAASPVELRLDARDRAVPVHVIAVPLRYDGAPARAILIRDLTEQKQLLARLMLADRMISVGTLAAGVAHEINNPLAYVSANLSLLAEELGKHAAALPPGAGEKWRRFVDEAREGGERIRGIVRDLGTFSRGGEERREPVDVRVVMDSSLKMAANELRHRAELVKDYGDVPAVEANPSQLGQVFLNLLLNAAQAIPDGHAADHQVRVRVRAEGGRVLAEVSDTGSGIAPEIRARIFDPFFTTKPVGAGTGLGLAICHRIVSEFGGEIAVESEPGRGARFTVSLPASSRPLRTAAPAPASSPSSSRGRVLVVDDEPAVATVIRRVLGGEHDVTTVDHAQAALAQVARGERFDVILCDLMMPEMNGAELYRELARVAPELPPRIIFISGGVFTPELRAFLDAVPNPRIDKPFAVAALRELVRARVAKLRAL